MICADKMDLLRETVDHAADRFDALLKARIDQLDKVLADRIKQAQDIVNGLRITNVTAFDVPESRAAIPVEQKP